MGFAEGLLSLSALGRASCSDVLVNTLVGTEFVLITIEVLRGEKCVLVNVGPVPAGVEDVIVTQFEVLLKLHWRRLSSW